MHIQVDDWPLVILQIHSHRWSTSTSTRSPPSALETSVLRASTTRRPCTLASACSATLCLTGKSSQSPSAVSSSVLPSSSATTGRSRARLARLREEACVCKWVCDSFDERVSVPQHHPHHWPLALPNSALLTSDGFIHPHSVDVDLEHNTSSSFNSFPGWCNHTTRSLKQTPAYRGGALTHVTY